MLNIFKLLSSLLDKNKLSLLIIKSEKSERSSLLLKRHLFNKSFISLIEVLSLIFKNYINYKDKSKSKVKSLKS